MSIITIIISIIILLMSVVIHEVAHGYVAWKLGDPTAKLQGRLTLNPLPHLDMVGSVIVPIILIAAQSPFFLAWAKPVPFNPYNFKKFRRWGAALVGIAGPVSNLIIAAVVALAARFIIPILPSPDLFIMITQTAVVTNIALAVFNLVPVPPLDGHHVLFALLPPSADRFKAALSRYSFVLFLVFFLFLWRFIEPLIFVIANGFWRLFF